MDTGLGRDGYSIIGQGKIAEIVSAKSGERREIFEEAAGISSTATVRRRRRSASPLRRKTWSGCATSQANWKAVWAP